MCGGIVYPGSGSGEARHNNDSLTREVPYKVGPVFGKISGHLFVFIEYSVCMSTNCLPYLEGSLDSVWSLSKRSQSTWPSVFSSRHCERLGHRRRRRRRRSLLFYLPLHRPHRTLSKIVDDSSAQRRSPLKPLISSILMEFKHQVPIVRFVTDSAATLVIYFSKLAGTV